MMNQGNRIIEMPLSLIGFLCVMMYLCSPRSQSRGPLFYTLIGTHNKVGKIRLRTESEARATGDLRNIDISLRQSCPERLYQSNVLAILSQNASYYQYR